ncbi:MAG: hypothetical protein Q9165_001187 [Trypethelium subeluteriae]
MKDAPIELRSFANELSVFNSVLQEVKEYVKAFRTSGFSTRDELNLELVGVTLKQCNAELWDIYDAIKDKDAKQSLSFLRRLGSSSSWVFDRDERVKSTERLNRARDTLTVAISTSLGHQNMVIRDEVHLTREDIAAVNKSQQEVLSLLSAVFAAGQERVKSLDSRADEERTRSETRLRDISDKFQAEFEAFSLRNSADDIQNAATAVTPEQPSPNADQNSESAAISSDPSPREQRRAYSAVKPSEFPQQMKALVSALRDFETQLSTKARVQLSPFLDTKTSQDFQRAITDQLYKGSQKQINKKGSLSKLVDSVQAHNKFLEVMAGSESSGPVWASVCLILQASSRWQEESDSLVEMFVETGEALRLCEREYELYQESMTKEPFMQLYTEFLDFCLGTIRMLQLPTLIRRSAIMQPLRPDFQNSISRVRKIAASIRDEAEFQGRLELRHAHKRIVAVEVQQHKMLAAMEGQKKILASMAEERRLVAMMKDQQTILQALQQLQMRLQEIKYISSPH